MFSGLDLRKGAKVGMEWYPPWLLGPGSAPQAPRQRRVFRRQRKYLDKERPRTFVM